MPMVYIYQQPTYDSRVLEFFEIKERTKYGGIFWNVVVSGHIILNKRRTFLTGKSQRQQQK